MNQLRWSRREQVALLLAFVVGAALSVIIGYFAYAVGRSDDVVSFQYWLSRPLRYSVHGWAIVGGTLGAATKLSAR